ncbi:MAG TPA: M48 family metallopeptidase, partial [Polyangiaceae bacterium LLY-WYZ-14_1]|nr:M48 family metallopeptidase [Polyangiaceae bacterium LLY-WYZ-14_1]
MALPLPLDFRGYVERKKAEALGGETGARYAFSSDVTMLKTLRGIRPVELAATSVVRTQKDLLRSQLLGTSTRVGPRQFPSIHLIARDCAETLGVPVPDVYVTNSPFINAYTFGTDDESFIVLHSALIDHYDETELRFVIGHETGHIQNKHVVFGTVLRAMRTAAGAMILKVLLPPLEMALYAWSRRAEITCDRAGLLCSRDLVAACRSFAKLACGSQKLYREIDVESYLEQLDAGRSGMGRFLEAMASHPYLPKRIEALRIFSQSQLYLETVGAPSPERGLPMDEVDRRTAALMRNQAREATEPGEGGH